jgi:hypothetical protein
MQPWIVYECGPYYATVIPNGYEIFKNGATAGTRCAYIGFKGEEGLRRVRAEIARRLLADGARLAAPSSVGTFEAAE